MVVGFHCHLNVMYVYNWILMDSDIDVSDIFFCRHCCLIWSRWQQKLYQKSVLIFMIFWKDLFFYRNTFANHKWTNFSVTNKQLWFEFQETVRLCDLWIFLFFFYDLIKIWNCIDLWWIDVQADFKWTTRTHLQHLISMEVNFVWNYIINYWW